MQRSKRVSTPSEAIKAGADYIVVGRPIWNAKDPILAVNEILKECAFDLKINFNLKDYIFV